MKKYDNNITNNAFESDDKILTHDIIDMICYHTTYGDILDLDIVQNRKQEFRARMWRYNLKIGLLGIINSYKNGCQNLSEMAEYLDVTEEYLLNTLTLYRSKYGVCTTVDKYIIYFEPSLAIMKIY